MSDLIQIVDRKSKKSGYTPRVRKREPGPRPEWLTVRYVRTETYDTVAETKNDLGLVTVCEEARCPNRHECWSAGTATFMLMGDICTRRCGFCAVSKGAPRELDPDEPRKTGEAVSKLGVKHAVITSVNRDELPDGGAQHFADTVTAIRTHSPQTRIELLVPDFLGDRDALNTVLDAGPHVVAHNMETISRLYRRVRPQAIYQRSLDVLAHSKNRGFRIKSGIMLGLGEKQEEIRQAISDLARIGLDILTLGQYLQPSSKYAPIDRWATPEEFAQWKKEAHDMGVEVVESGPLVRSSYHAEEQSARFASDKRVSA